MKDILKIYNMTSSLTKAMLKITLIFIATVLLCSVFSFYFAEYFNFYYEMKTLSTELLIALRSCSVMLFTGTVFTAFNDKTNTEK